MNGPTISDNARLLGYQKEREREGEKEREDLAGPYLYIYAHALDTFI